MDDILTLPSLCASLLPSPQRLRVLSLRARGGERGVSCSGRVPVHPHAALPTDDILTLSSLCASLLPSPQRLHVLSLRARGGGRGVSRSGRVPGHPDAALRLEAAARPISRLPPTFFGVAGLPVGATSETPPERDPPPLPVLVQPY
jgi:hypothetical protein